MVVQYYVAASLDGFIADAHGSLDWLMELGQPDGVDPGLAEFVAGVGACCMGRTTYDWLLEHAFPEGEPTPIAGEGVPVWVLTHRSLPPAPGNEVHAYDGDVTGLHRQMCAAAGGRNLWVMGGGEVAGQFLDAGLLDEIVVAVMPLTLGGGAPLLPRHLSAPLELVEVHPGGSGAVLARYRVTARR